MKRPRRTASPLWMARLAAFAGGLAGLGVVAFAASCAAIESRLAGPSEHLEIDVIQAIIATESPVYYRDGVTPVGVFFQSEHRRYLSADALPPAWVAAIIAAEDDGFWSHSGVSAKGILRAIRANLLAGRVVAGGSTLTQQTAKNLFYRPDRSASSKWTELVNAIGLERRYEKREILSFYANQFHVTGNGRGLAIAARHFFDRDVDELGLIELAFLAGLVKGPARYDPFLGDAAAREAAAVRAHDRARYVLRRLVEEPIDVLAAPDGKSPTSTEVAAWKAEAEAALASGFKLPFRRGTFRWNSSAVLDEVARRLSEPPFEDILRDAGIDDPATSGLTVVTTLDANLQREAEYGLWHHLTEVGTWLDGAGPEVVRRDANLVRWSPHLPALRHEFRNGIVTARGERGVLDVDLGGRHCLVDRAALERLATAIARGRAKDATAKASSREVDALSESLAVGTGVWLSVRDVAPDGKATCDLERIPRLQGALVVAEDGEMRAMVPGNDGRNFNRVGALRQMGSTFKPIVYHTALMLGWNPTDPLDNAPAVFQFSTTQWWPGADHEPAPIVSLAAAGTSSENIASAWLLHHLVDRLGPDELEQLARDVDLWRREGEDAESYGRRLAQLGIRASPARDGERHFLAARHEVSGDLSDEDRRWLGTWSSGWGLDAERERQASSVERLAALDRIDWRSWRERGVACRAALDSMVAGSATQGISEVEGEWICGEGAAPGRERPGGWLGRLLGGNADVVDATQVRIGSQGPTLEAVERLERAILRRQLSSSVEDAEDVDVYAPERLIWNGDFRTLLGLRAVVSVARAYGVMTPLQHVMSLPLGASEVTLEEMVAVYDGMADGTAHVADGRGSLGPVAPQDRPLALIQEVRASDGRVLYQLATSERIVASPAIAELTRGILRDVVRYGTGQRARSAVDAGGAPLPLGGKTGTTNDYRNAAFVGFVPRWNGEWDGGGGWTVGAYVGHDDNAPLVAGRIRLQGANGALPAWLAVARALWEGGFIGDPGRAPEGGWLEEPSPGLIEVPVDDNGLPTEGGPRRTLTRVGLGHASDLVELHRAERAFPSTSELRSTPPVPPIGFGTPDE